MCRETPDAVGAWRHLASSEMESALADCLAGPERVVAALMIARTGAAPLDPGAVMLVRESGAIVGSVAGGCVDAALAAAARRVLAGDPPRTISHEISEQVASATGLSCGGSVSVFVHELIGAEREVVRAAWLATAASEPVALATLLDGPSAGAKMAIFRDRDLGRLRAGPELDRAVACEARALLGDGGAAVHRYVSRRRRPARELAVHIHARPAAPRMVIVGEVGPAQALAELARSAGYDVTRCGEILTGGLGRQDAIVVMTGDSELDERMLRRALRTGAGYVGGLGGRRAQRDRGAQLRAAGVADSELVRIRVPCGLEIGARTPAEIAVAILAEAIALRRRPEARTRTRPALVTGSPPRPRSRAA